MGDNSRVTRRRTWWIGLVVVVLIAAGAVLTWHQLNPGTPTRPSVGPATPLLDQAIDVVVAGAGDDAAVTVSGLVPTTSCDGGTRYTRTADLYTDPGSEATVIHRIAQALPPAMAPSWTASLGGGAASLNATLGGGGTLQVLQLDQGWIAATATTDCRAPGAASSSAAASPDPGLTSALGSLGTAPTTWHSDAVACTSGQIVTVSTASGTISLDGIAARLAKLPPAGATVFTSPSDRISWRVGNVSTVIAAADDGTHVTAQTTQSC